MFNLCKGRLVASDCLGTSRVVMWPVSSGAKEEGRRMMTKVKAEDLPLELQERLGIASLIDGTAPSPGIRYKNSKRTKKGSPFHLREEQTLILAKEADKGDR